MPAPKGNQYWMIRSKHGRDATITDPDQFWNDCLGYFNWVDEHPIIDKGVYGKDAMLVDVPRARPYTKDALALWCGVAGWRSIEALKSKSEDFMQIITRVETIIANQKFEGAVVGIFKENIIARDLGIADRQDQVTSIKIEGVSTDEINELLEE